MKTRKLCAIFGPIKAWDWDTVTSIRGKNDACEKTKRLTILLLLMVMVFGLTGPAQAYTIVTLDVPGAIDTQARGINDSGDVVGNDIPSRMGFVYEGSTYTTIRKPLALRHDKR